MTIGKEFVGQAVERDTPSGGKVIFGVGHLVTVDDVDIPAVHLRVIDPQGEMVIDASLSKATFEIMLLTMGETLDRAQWVTNNGKEDNSN